MTLTKKMDTVTATIVAALIGGGSALAQPLISRWVSGGTEKETEEKIKEAVHEKYDELKSRLSDNSIRLLHILEPGENLADFQLLEKLHVGLEIPDPLRRKFESEFWYRLEYLKLLGLLAPAGNEYAISNLGKAVLGEARTRNEYQHILRTGV